MEEIPIFNTKATTAQRLKKEGFLRTRISSYPTQAFPRRQPTITIITKTHSNERTQQQPQTSTPNEEGIIYFPIQNKQNASLTDS